MIKSAFCYVYIFWLSKFVDQETDPIPRAFNALWGGKCRYCREARAFLMGAGFVLSFFWFWSGLFLQCMVYAMTVGERKWLCDSKPTDPPTSE